MYKTVLEPKFLGIKIMLDSKRKVTKNDDFIKKNGVLHFSQYLAVVRIAMWIPSKKWYVTLNFQKYYTYRKIYTVTEECLKFGLWNLKVAKISAYDIKKGGLLIDRGFVERGVGFKNH